MAQCTKCGKKSIFLKVNFEGLCEDCQRSVYSEMRSLLTPEHQEAMNLQDKINALQQQVNSINADISSKQKNMFELDSAIRERQSRIVQLDEQLYFEEFGLYKPTFDFVNSEQYKQRLSQIREGEKALIKSNQAVTGFSNWQVNGSASQGMKMVKDTQKLLLRAFNNECDDAIDKVKYNNYELSVKRINKSCDTISKLGKIMGISITNDYRNLKLTELTLAFEYRQMKQKEKEEQKELKAQMREEAKLQKEIEAERKKLEKEGTHYANALAKINLQLSADPDNADLLEKQAELQNHIEETQKAIKDVDYREANKRAGYVYVISNIGAFGEGVYKIGMTRRLDPTERVDELGDASVPFDFDIHAMIFSEDAPKLEAALHKAFENKKLNMVNTRREFFRVSLEEIKNIVAQNYDRTAEFIDFPEAEQYRISQQMRSN
ncbi:MAG: DUF4041 domain-containing protein [Acetobacter sp.]|nr:DUF4041 domain-containing protein [Bacteroides sp.]MCM1341669.1 DUF4041 domain-containing protein [Acetobacter sp.]MCM1434282.1 DUF4041 domain-containing protein [Clostridiales bacterium]